MATAADSRRRSSVEEDVISIDSASAAASHLIDANTGHPITLSKKAIHQRDADENLFLRFLELDPPPDAAGGGSGAGGAAGTSTSGIPAAGSTTGGLLSSTLSSVLATTSSSTGTPQPRRMSTFKPSAGRTPFTITKKLTRTADKGFGFSIVWTHPPRVEKVEPGLSADKSGITPGDYVIFVDKHNVVTMPEADVLNLIRSQGNMLTLEIFRRSTPALSSAAPSVTATNANQVRTNPNVNGVSASVKSRMTSVASNYTTTEDNNVTSSPALKQSIALGPRSSTACSNASIETTKRRLHLPQVTFSKESITPCHGVEDQRRRFLLQLISREQNFVSALQFGVQRFVTPLLERKDLISPNDHRTLFQNIDELIRISEDILEQLVHDDHEPPINFASRVYLSKTTAICAAYKKYCNGIKRADCVLVNKSRQPGSEFVTFITEPQVPRKRPDLTMFIHRPLQHFREILKLMQLLASHCRVDSEEHKNFTSVISELQAAYREITVGGGLMEPLGEGRPLLTLQDLEARMVFTRCKPFTLAVQGRQWIFGGDLSRVEGRSIKPYWTLLFSDILLFAKVSRDRVLFITEEPLPIVNIVDSCFNIRKKSTEFRITIDPNGRAAESPTAYCAPDLSRTPKKNARRKSLILRAPSLELKAVWQNLLQRQIFLVNAALGSTPLSSPLDSPDVLNTLVPLSDIGATTTSMASIKLPSMDSINMRNQQVRLVKKQLNKQTSYDSIANKFITTTSSISTTTTTTSTTQCGIIGQLDTTTATTSTTSLNSNNCYTPPLPVPPLSPLPQQQNQMKIPATNSRLTDSPKLQRIKHLPVSRLSQDKTNHNCIKTTITTTTTTTSSHTLWLNFSHSNNSCYNSTNTTTTTTATTASNCCSSSSSCCCNHNNKFSNIHNNNTSNSSIIVSQMRGHDPDVPQCPSKSLTAIPETISELPELTPSTSEVCQCECLVHKMNREETQTQTQLPHQHHQHHHHHHHHQRPLVEFSLSSVGRSFIDETDEFDDNLTNPSLTTPDTPTPNISPSSSSNRCLSDTFSNDFVTIQQPSTPSVIVSPLGGPSHHNNAPSSQFSTEFNRNCNVAGLETGFTIHKCQIPSTNTNQTDPTHGKNQNSKDETNSNADCYAKNDYGILKEFFHNENLTSMPFSQYGGSWDLLELDMDFHEVNFDPSYCNDVEECVFLGDDPFGVLPCRPTPPDSLDL